MSEAIHFNDIKRAVDELEDTVSRFLTARGWERTCQVPGSYWLWKRRLPNGSVYLLESDMAAKIQSAIDDDEEDGGEE
jgi:hypothetical protein